MNQNYYVTTPIYYPTGVPHIGTAYTTFIADTLARYHRSQGDDTLFLTGTDEHGGNIAQKAETEGLDPKGYVDKYADIYQDVWKNLGISNDYFIRTTDKNHEKFAAELLQKSFDNGDIYEGEYSGWYCESCEAYYTESDLAEGKCPNHPTKEPVFTREKNYYFRWSKYQDWLLEFYERNPSFVQPEKWLNYVKEFVKKGLTDIPVTRANVKWGIPVPFDPAQTIYVWYDALPNYLSYLYFPENETQGFPDKFWPEVTHVVGKDIIKFHAILWPAMLKSAGFNPPKHVLVHGFFTVNGQKIGKSNNNAIDPAELAQKYGVDPVRYALLSEFQIGNDGDFNFARLETKYTSELANNWGNLLNRVIHLAGTLGLNLTDENLVSTEFKQDIDAKTEQYHQFFAEYKLFEAIQLVGELTDFGNKYITEHKPWAVRQDLRQSSRHAHHDGGTEGESESKVVLANLGYLLKVVNELYTPILPESAEKAKKALESGERVILFPKLEK